ncbi:hypothetical protein HQ590_11950 [bacterium]|nr:hypothetical protein [bacterium]
MNLVISHPALTPPAPRQFVGARTTGLGRLQERYLDWRAQYGAGVSALKYLAIAILSGLLVLVLVPGRYLEKLVTRPGSPLPTPGAMHYLLSALAVGAILSGLAYVLALTAPSATDTAANLTAPTGDGGGSPVATRSDSTFLSGAVVLISLAIHALVWFFVRGKLRQVEDDEGAAPALRLRRLENLDIFLDLPLFTGLALTVIAFILITLDAGMSRHFAYTSTVVGILSAVSLRIRYQYPLKERLIHL